MSTAAVDQSRSQQQVSSPCDRELKHADKPSCGPRTSAMQSCESVTRPAMPDNERTNSGSSGTLSFERLMDLAKQESIHLPVQNETSEHVSVVDRQTVHRSRKRSRVNFRPQHVVAVVFILVSTLCASITILIQQGLSISALSGVAENSYENRNVPELTDRKRSQSGNIELPGMPLLDDESAQSQSGSECNLGTGNCSLTGNSVNNGVSPDSESNGTKLINLNSANSLELQTIAGIGPVTAQRIIDYRTKHGRFGSVEELMEIRGIGAKTYEKIKNQVGV